MSDEHSGEPIQAVRNENYGVSFWFVSWGDPVDMNPTRWQRAKWLYQRCVDRVRDAYAVLTGKLIAVDEQEYYDKF